MERPSLRLPEFELEEQSKGSFREEPFLGERTSQWFNLSFYSASPQDLNIEEQSLFDSSFNDHYKPIKAPKNESPFYSKKRSLEEDLDEPVKRPYVPSNDYERSSPSPSPQNLSHDRRVIVPAGMRNFRSALADCDLAFFEVIRSGLEASDWISELDRGFVYPSQQDGIQRPASLV